MVLVQWKKNRFMLQGIESTDRLTHAWECQMRCDI